MHGRGLRGDGLDVLVLRDRPRAGLADPPRWRPRPSRRGVPAGIETIPTPAPRFLIFFLHTGPEEFQRGVSDHAWHVKISFESVREHMCLKTVKQKRTWSVYALQVLFGNILMSETPLAADALTESSA